MRPSTIAIAFGAGRALVGVALLAAPGPIARGWVGADGTPASVLTRSLGARDLVIGAGLVAAAARDRDPAPWLVGGVARRLRRRGLHARRRRRHPEQRTGRHDGARGRRRALRRLACAAPSIDPRRVRRSNTSFVRIAIIGSGISGLTAAHLLHPEHEIVVYEAGDHVGGHTNTIRVDTDDATWHIDTGFIVLNDRNYPRFEALLDELGVGASRPT